VTERVRAVASTSSATGKAKGIEPDEMAGIMLNLKMYTFPRSALEETCKAIVHDGLRAVSIVYKIKK